VLVDLHSGPPSSRCVSGEHPAAKRTSSSRGDGWLASTCSRAVGVQGRGPPICPCVRGPTPWSLLVGTQGPSCHPMPVASFMLEPGLQDSVPTPAWDLESHGPWLERLGGMLCAPSRSPGSGVLAHPACSISWRALA